MISSRRKDKLQAYLHEKNVKERHDAIRDDVTAGVSTAIHVGELRKRPDHPVPEEGFEDPHYTVPFWKEGSYLEIEKYRHLSDNARKSAIEADVAHFFELVNQLRTRHQGWKLTVTLNGTYQGVRVPDGILVREEQEN